MKKYIVLLLILVKSLSLWANTDTLTLHDDESKLINKKYFTQLEDPSGKLTFNQVLKSNRFKYCRTDLPSLNVTNSVLWLKIYLYNKTSQPYIPISIGTGVIDHLDLYFNNRPTDSSTIHLAMATKNKNNSFLSRPNLINCIILPDSVRTIYLRIQSNVPDTVPVEFSSADKYFQKYSSKNIAFGIFTGIVIIMTLYNLLLYFTVKDKSYLYYVLYIILLGITQASSRGYGYAFVNPTVYNNYFIPITRILFWLAIIAFVIEFLQIKQQNRLIYKYTQALFILFITPLIFVLSHNFNIAYGFISVLIAVGTISLLLIGGYLYSKGYKPAKFFMLGWVLFLCSILVALARSKGIVAYNDFTANLVLFTSTIELVLFSIALADKINFYRAQNNNTQLLALKIARENERLITEQNIVLETRVLERTRELLESNKSLTRLIENLKEAQSQLIETEKMASLGQLTAGIAHEINNPINFVKSNVKPLKLDFEELIALLENYAMLEQKPDDAELLKRITAYKEKIDVDFIKNEITELLEGIEEGASRTAEIVQSLRAFSRTDEVELKLTDINKTILNTLVILRGTIPYYIEITPVLDKLPPLNCYPGKIGQVFMNIIQNGIQAIVAKKKHHKERLSVITKNYPENITIEIKDTGIGMSEQVRQKMFDPFFTTKDVGEGTGLGLSIVFGIIEKHHGHIEVQSEPGKGSSFLIMLPKTLT